MIIGLTGYIGSGKNETAMIIQELYPQFEHKKYATKLKIICAVVLGVPIEKLEDSDFKKLYIKELGMTVRELMQKVGTDCFRDIIDKDIWVKSLMSGYKALDPEKAISDLDILDYYNCKFPDWVISDVRFPNEANAIKERGGFIIRLNRFNISSTHSSETEIDNIRQDYTIDNNGTLEQLKEKINVITKKIIKSETRHN